ncbi:DNA-protecting protein DprA [bacterium]|jgi:DNA processing protein|nr:DNA-protecting protein DprA [bacterium]
MKSDFETEKFCLFYLKSIQGLKEVVIWKYLQDGLQAKQLYRQPPIMIAELVRQAKNDPEFNTKIQKEFELYQNAISILDKAYPDILKTIFDPPLFLFYQGNLDLLKSEYLLTIVGSRTLNNYHQATLKNLIQDLASSPLIIVSGLAFGTDALAHSLALENNLPTIAVLGSGFADSVLYPKQNLYLAKKILQQNGLILSEYPPNTKPALYQFPKRNRILAGLSRATVVISGAIKSGTLITAQCALDGAREVYALPGNINLTLSQGPNNLIEQGANILLSSDNILQIYDLEKNTMKENIKLDLQQDQVYQLLKIQAYTLEQIKNQTNLDFIILQKIIAQLEIMNLAKINKFNQIEII